jgi:hypothetical protein
MTTGENEMSESKYTPGPWHWVNSATDEPFDFDVQWDGNGYPSLRTVNEYGENKTEVRDGKTYTSWALPEWILTAEPMQNGNDAANARLIAAAPDLLESADRQCANIACLLERCKLDDLPSAWHEKFERELLEDRAVIDKAQGAA